MQPLPLLIHLLYDRWILLTDKKVDKYCNTWKTVQNWICRPIYLAYVDAQHSLSDQKTWKTVIWFTFNPIQINKKREIRVFQDKKWNVFLEC